MGAFFLPLDKCLDKRFDDGFFLALRLTVEADSSESDEFSESEDGGDSSIAVFALAIENFADALFFLVPPCAILLANGEGVDSSKSDDGINASDSSELSEEGGDGAIAVFALAFLALRLDGASSASSAAAATAAGGATVGAAVSEGDSATSAAAATEAGGATVGASSASSAAGRL